jgi:hypothetical protein
MRAMHQLAVPEESKHEDEAKRRNKCDEEFFPIHNLFRLKFLLNPIKPKRLIAKRLADVDLNLRSCSSERSSSCDHYALQR